jgi:hypothetical protein
MLELLIRRERSMANQTVFEQANSLTQPRRAVEALADETLLRYTSHRDHVTIWPQCFFHPHPWSDPRRMTSVG